MSDTNQKWAEKHAEIVLGVRTPDPKDFIPHYKPVMAPTLRRVDDTISLMVMDQNGHMSCLILSERTVCDFVLSGTLILGDLAHERKKVIP